MPITWRGGLKDGLIEYEGAVLDQGSRTVRVMSDIWEDERYATAWNGEREVDVILSDWAYPRAGGGWTRDWEEKDPGGHQQFFTPQVVVDATPEVRRAAQARRALLGRAAATKHVVGEAGKIRVGKRVRVFKGKKVPLGVYTVAGGVFDSQYGKTVHLDDESGTRYRFVSVDNLIVSDPMSHIQGPVVCGRCEKEFDSAKEAGMVVTGHGHCLECHLKFCLAGTMDAPLPETAKNPEGFALYPGGVEYPGSEDLIRALLKDPNDLTTWLVFCDFLEENGDPRSETIRAKLVGKIRERKAPIKRKDLSATPWSYLDSLPGVARYHCTVTGFPGWTFDRVIARLAIHTATQKTTLRLIGFKEGEEYDPGKNYWEQKYHVGGVAARQAKAILPEKPRVHELA